jgi:AraC family transcriptional regulator, regulatory protein of adaptative response / methylated-DNA-[protein]-cysteine methyltransferase
MTQQISIFEGNSNSPCNLFSYSEITNSETNVIEYNMYPSDFGKLLIASTKTGICKVSLIEDDKFINEEMELEFPRTQFVKTTTDFHLKALQIISGKMDFAKPIPLHVKGSPFQIKIWNLLLQIPFGSTRTYGDLALQIGQKNAARAVGTAIGKNPVAILIPCHRVVQNSGKLGGYRWGLERKKALLDWEFSKN